MISGTAFSDLTSGPTKSTAPFKAVNSVLRPGTSVFAIRGCGRVVSVIGDGFCAACWPIAVMATKTSNAINIGIRNWNWGQHFIRVKLRLELLHDGLKSRIVGQYSM